MSILIKTLEDDAFKKLNELCSKVTESDPNYIACATSTTVALYAEKGNEGLDIFYLLFAGTLVFFMQTGFAMLCAGSVRQKNVKNIMLKNLLDACGGALSFWAVGYAFAYGGQDSSKVTFIGDTNFLLMDEDSGDGYIFFFFQFAFAATASTIVAGTVAERCKMSAYLCYSVVLSGFVYPVIVHSIWSSSGFFCAWNDNPTFGSGVIDFAGSGVVHLTGGTTALVAAKILGPRLGRFHDSNGNILPEPRNFPPHSAALQILGTFILWVGWYGFNPGSTLMISAGNGYTAALCAVTTTLSAATAAVTAVLTTTIFDEFRTGEQMYDLSMAMNGALSGLVGVTAGCAVVEPWAAVVIGIVSAWVYICFSSLLVKLRIDDAVDAVPVHFGSGLWGLIAVGLFASPRNLERANFNSTHVGWFYEWSRGSGKGYLLLNQIFAIIWIISWTGALMGPFFYVLSFFNMFRVDPIEEEVGLDIAHHKGAAYDFSGSMAKNADEIDCGFDTPNYNSAANGASEPAEEHNDLSNKVIHAKEDVQCTEGS